MSKKSEVGKTLIGLTLVITCVGKILVLLNDKIKRK